MPEDKRQNEIIRIQKKRNNFVMLDKGFLEDNRLSYKAKGILAYLLSKPDNWKVIVKDLINHSKDGKKAVYSGLRELKENGYYKKIPVRDEAGRRISHWESVIFEIPQEPELQDEKSLFTQKGEVDDNAENSTLSLLTPFVYIENVKERNVEIQKGQHNNNYNSNNEFNKKSNLSDQSVLDNETENKKTDSIDKISNKSAENENGQKNKESLNANATDQSIRFAKPSAPKYNYSQVEEIIKTQIDYDYLIEDNKTRKDTLDEIVFVIVTTICTEYKDGYISMGEERVPAEAVRSVFFKLSSEHIEYFIDCFNRQTESITKLPPYIRKSLYYNYGTVSHHYTNRVHHDMPQLAERKL